MTTRIDAAHRTDASVKRLRLPLTRIGRKQQGLKQTTHRFGARCGSPPALPALGMRDRAVFQTGDACGMKFRRCSRSAFTIVLFSGNWCAAELNETALLKLSCLQACSDLIC